jgi:hypothetical protein
MPFMNNNNMIDREENKYFLEWETPVLYTEDWRKTLTGSDPGDEYYGLEPS